MSITVPLHYSDSGDGPVILVLHGLFGSNRNWTTIVKQLCKNYRVINVDLRNHGQSPHTDSMSYTAQSNDVFLLMDKLQLQSPIVLGHSMGGKIAMACVLRQPEMFGKLIVVDIAPVNYQHQFNSIFSALNNLPVSSLTSRSHADSELSRWIDNPVLRQFLLQNLQRADSGFEWRVNLPALTASIPDISVFPQGNETPVEVPTLFIAGRESQHIRTEHHAAISHLFPNHQLVSIKNAGHWPHSEQPEAFMSVLNEFLEPN